jgi:DME family drug/metabolite transporter
MALVPMFVGDVLFGWGLARVRASTATALSLSETVVAAVLAVLVVGERLPALGWLGAALIAASLFVLTLPAPRLGPKAADVMRDGDAPSQPRPESVAAQAATPE